MKNLARHFVRGPQTTPPQHTANPARVEAVQVGGVRKDVRHRPLAYGVRSPGTGVQALPAAKTRAERDRPCQSTVQSCPTRGCTHRGRPTRYPLPHNSRVERSLRRGKCQAQRLTLDRDVVDGRCPPAGRRMRFRWKHSLSLWLRKASLRVREPAARVSFCRFLAGPRWSQDALVREGRTPRQCPVRDRRSWSGPRDPGRGPVSWVAESLHRRAVRSEIPATRAAFL